MKNKDYQKLRECPFCGSTDILVKGYPYKATYHGHKHYFVICHDCGGQTKKFYAYEEKAIKAWNTRTNTIPVGNGEDYEVVQK